MRLKLLSLSLSLSVCLLVCLPVSLSLSVCLSVSPYVCLSVSLTHWSWGSLWTKYRGCQIDSITLDAFLDRTSLNQLRERDRENTLIFFYKNITIYTIKNSYVYLKFLLHTNDIKQLFFHGGSLNNQAYDFLKTCSPNPKSLSWKMAFSILSWIFFFFAVFAGILLFWCCISMFHGKDGLTIIYICYLLGGLWFNSL